MFMVIVISALAVLAIAATLVALMSDGYHRIPTHPARLPNSVEPNQLLRMRW